MVIVTFIMTLVVLAVTLLSCVADIRSMRIPNNHALIIAACFVPAWLAAPEVFASLWQHLSAFGVVLGVTYFMFCKNMMGGGDSKLASALALWVGLKGLFPFMLYMAIIGGILGAFAILMRKTPFFKNPPPGSWAAQAQSGRSVLPYGVAISFGAWAALFYTGLVHNQINEVFKIIH